MKLQNYIESGVLELYVLDLLDASENAEVQRMLLLHSELRKEVEWIALGLEQYAQTKAIEPSADLKEKIMQAINNLAIINADELGLIDENADYRNWLQMVMTQFSDAVSTDNFCAVIAEREGLKQMLVVSSFDIEEETHEDVYESFLILKGKCRCTVGSNVFYLEAGGYTQIPLKSQHMVEVIDGPVMAIVQYIQS